MKLAAGSRPVGMVTLHDKRECYLERKGKAEWIHHQKNDFYNNMNSGKTLTKS